MKSEVLPDLGEDDSLILVRIYSHNGQVMAETEAAVSPRWYRVVAEQLRDLADSLEDDTPERKPH